jgi:hypothetical protein
VNQTLTFHSNSQRSGVNHDFPFTMGGTWRKFISVNLATPVRGGVLLIKDWVFSHGPWAGQTHNLVLVAATDNKVHAYAEDQLLSGSIAALWSVSLGVTPITRGGSNIAPPLGVCGTPVADPRNGRVFVMAMHNVGTPSAQVGAYTLFALDLNDGTTLQHAILTDAGAPGRPTFNADTLDQRSGLNLVGGRVYATFAAFLGYDAGVYHGWVAACTANNVSEQLFLPMTRTILAAGVWGPAGAAAGPDGTLYVATGNSTYPSGVTDAGYWAGLPVGKHPGDIGDYFCGVVRVGLCYSGRTATLGVLDWYQPTDARTQNSADLDFGGSSPVVLPPINGQELVAIAPKNGNVYLLNRLNLGGWGGHMFTQHYFSDESKAAPCFFRTTTGDNLLVVGAGGSPGLTAFHVSVTSPTVANLTVAWSTGMALGDAFGSPTIMANPGLSDVALAWIADGTPASGQNWLDGAVLRAYNVLTGALVFDSGSVPSNHVTEKLAHFPAVTCGGNSVFLSTYNGFVGYTQLPGKHVVKESKDLKDLKEHKEKEFKEQKEIEKNQTKEFLPEKSLVPEPKLPKEVVEQPGGGPIGDPLMRVLQGLDVRVSALEQQQATGRPFITPEQRPAVGESVLKTPDKG